MKGSDEEMILREEVKNFFAQKKNYDGNMHKAYEQILGKCTEVLRNKLKSRKYWEKYIKNQPIGILKTIKEINHNYQYS